MKRTSYLAAKRLFDIGLAGAGLVVLAPVFAVIAMAVRLDSTGPVFFGHRRVGQHFRPIRVWKFRTMRAGPAGADITVGGDDRITRVGAVLRRTKLDELPQLFNVVKGDMSVVGPRPEVQRFVDQFAEQYEVLLKVRPGLTDPASLHYRDEESLLAKAHDPEEMYEKVVLPTKLQLSAEYLNSASMREDLRLMAATARQLFPSSSPTSRTDSPPAQGTSGQTSAAYRVGSEYQWVFVIGAARSGTKFLRDTLSTSAQVACIPYDVGYLWREGQHDLPHDELDPQSATPHRIRRIRATLARLAAKNGAKPGQIVIEKTVGNTLRVEFLRTCFPEARFIHIERDILDVVASSYGQWIAPTDRSYLLKKLRYFPFRSWRYALWFVRNQFATSSASRIWGPRYRGIDDDLADGHVVSAVVNQAVRSVSEAAEHLESDAAFRIHYRDLEFETERWHDLLKWLGIKDADKVTEVLRDEFHAGAGWPGRLDPQQQHIVLTSLGREKTSGSTQTTGTDELCES